MPRTLLLIVLGIAAVLELGLMGGAFRELSRSRYLPAARVR